VHRRHVACGLEGEPFSGKRGISLMLSLCPLDESLNAASVQVRQLTGQKFIQPHFNRENKTPLERIPLGGPPVILPTQLQLRNPAVNMEELSSLLESVYRPRVRFVTVTNSHMEGYVISPRLQVQLHIEVPRLL
jgi:hypothetical protein